jgi:hypothetical protein
MNPGFGSAVRDPNANCESKTAHRAKWSFSTMCCKVLNMSYQKVISVGTRDFPGNSNSFRDGRHSFPVFERHNDRISARQ